MVAAVKVRSTGVREAKAHLSRLLRDVQQGREWIITERGTPIAKLVPIEKARLSLEERISRLEDEGIIEPAPRDVRRLPPPLPIKDGLPQKWLQEDRDRRPGT
ncbi:MAG: type II toxin-antitoxin system prevent-host-death family antitoxin [Bacillati bacterium ANGP1]|uniref:Antitoxin n=1 Tax=Candidatus Segetimicrobium genomatis TaxID=2569760 RepID=A0A537K3L4_9BACT|nr:MAG: type II toxin-antitoxin system prevent-host-death family antitoxin [Terrabacteria group bacterium ANGP1]